MKLSKILMAGTAVFLMGTSASHADIMVGTSGYVDSDTRVNTTYRNNNTDGYSAYTRSAVRARTADTDRDVRLRNRVYVNDGTVYDDGRAYVYRDGDRDYYDNRRYYRDANYDRSDRNYRVRADGNTRVMSSDAMFTTDTRSRANVMAVQKRLNRMGYNVAVDGVYGPQTRAALRNYQRSNGLYASGNLNNATLMYMEKGKGYNNIEAAAGTDLRYGTNERSANANLTARDIMAVQRELRDEGFNIAVDGIMGSRTRMALMNFQEQNGLKVTGTVNAQTINALRS